MSKYEGISSSKPRLIVEYQPPQELQDRARELDTTSTRWKFWRTDDAASKPFMNTMAAIISNPVFYDGTMYLFAQPSSQETKLYALRLGGGNLWQPKAISIRPGSHAMVSPAGRLYSIGEDRLVLYDLKQAGAEIRNVPIANFKPALRPMLGEDGSLYAMPPGALFGFNPDLQEMWRYPGAKTDMPDASRVVLSPDAGRYAYMLAKRGTATQLVRLETATGNATVSGLPVIDVTQKEKLPQKIWTLALPAILALLSQRDQNRITSFTALPQHKAATCSRIRGTRWSGGETVSFSVHRQQRWKRRRRAIRKAACLCSAERHR